MDASRIFISLVVSVFAQCLLADVESANVPTLTLDIPKPFYVNPYNDKNCNGVVRLQFVNREDLLENNFEVIESKPPGKFDQEALEALLSLHPEGSPRPQNSLLVRYILGGKYSHSRFKYFTDCNVKSRSEQPPNKSLNTDTSVAGAG